jgi:hypothetical protein
MLCLMSLIPWFIPARWMGLRAGTTYRPRGQTITALVIAEPIQGYAGAGNFIVCGWPVPDGQVFARRGGPAMD